MTVPMVENGAKDGSRSKQKLVFISVMGFFLLFGVALLVGRDFFDGPRSPQACLDDLAERKDGVSLAVYDIPASGAAGGSEDLGLNPVVTFQTDVPRPLGGMVDVLVLAAYGQAVASGQLNPDEAVPVFDWERFYLPGLDGGAHKIALKELGLQTGGNDEALTNTSVKLSDVVFSMIRASDSSATDYILSRLEADAIDRVKSVYDINGHDTVLRPRVSSCPWPPARHGATSTPWSPSAPTHGRQRSRR